MAEEINRLVVYGTLAPGRENYDQLSALKGTWSPGTVTGKLIATGWAATMGYPALFLDPQGETIEVQIFESAELPEHWQRLDEFEGPGYRRVITQVKTSTGNIPAWIYEAASGD
jgi:gamma-glutamylcyclotransferase (GGCT)/AIG2-like uncharacterized protein YtfP